jgi:hypothetical protein
MSTLNSAYELHLLRQHNGNLAASGLLEARPFTAALPPSGGHLHVLETVVTFAFLLKFLIGLFAER